MKHTPLSRSLLESCMMDSVRKASYLAVPGLVAAVLFLHLGPVLLAGLFSYLILDVTYKFLTRAMPRWRARWLALLVFLVSGWGISWAFTTFLRDAFSTLPEIAADAIPKFVALMGNYGLQPPFADSHELKQLAVNFVRDNAEFITRASGVVTIRLFQLLIGIVIAVLCFFCEPDHKYGANVYDALRREVDARIAAFMLSFERVFGAQLAISLVNTTLTAVFLLTMGFPYTAFLVPATFILGMLPIIGNILSNTLIVGTGLTVSSRHAAFALLFLVLIHKGEYFLNSRIVGSRIQSPMWQTLLVILAGEALLGIPGMILGPALLHYVRVELSAIPAEGGRPR